MPPALKSGNSFVRASHWLLTGRHFRHGEDAALFQVAVKIATVVAARPRGGFPCRPPRVYGGVGGPSLSTWVCPRPAGAVPLVGADGAGRFAVGGVAVQMWDGSVIFDSLAVGLSRLCGVGTCPRKDAVAADRRTSLEGPLHNRLALLLALTEWKYFRKKSTTSRDGRI